MRSKLCIILPILFTIFSPLFGISLNVSALKYSIGNFPIMHDVMYFEKLNDHYVYYGKGLSSFGITFQNGDEPSGFTFPRVWQYAGEYQVSNEFPNGRCVLPFSGISPNDIYYNNGVRVDRRSDYAAYTYNYQFLGETEHAFFDFSNIGFGDSTPFVLDRPFHEQGPWASYYRDSFCNMYEQKYETNSSNYPNVSSNLPIWYFGGLNNISVIDGRADYLKSVPYTYAYNYINFSQIDYEDGGIVTRDGISLDDIFNSNVRKFRRFGFNLPIFDTINSSLDCDHVDDCSLTENVYNFEIVGSLNFDGDYSLSSDSTIGLSVTNDYIDDFDPETDLSNGGVYDEEDEVIINNHLVHNLDLLYDGGRHNRRASIDCSYTEYHISDGDDSNRLDFSCYYDPVSANAFSSIINFHYISNIALNFRSDSRFVSSDGAITLSNFYVITNNNDRPGFINASAGHILTGGDTDSAPGQEGWQDQAQASYDEALRGLFNFTFINPFSPIFALFTSQSQCASIPTIAGMLHSNETQICPWFSSETRAIVTPVIGIFSMMLVFGFAVRWLGARSGNLFEDSLPDEGLARTKGITTDNYHFSNKYRRRK